MSGGPRAALQAALRDALDDARLEVTAVQGVGGGCISPTARLSTTAGPFFAKWNDGGPPDLFLREADGLRAMAESGTTLAIPRVVVARGPQAGAPALIVMEMLQPGPLDEEALGRGLAELHQSTSPRFGFPVDTYCGTTLQPNAPRPSWAEFYATQRLGPLVASIADERGLASADRAVHERVIERLPELVAEGAPPALVHGDLWSGNALGSSRGPAVVDPACAFADREMELGMMTLFGGFSGRCLAAYEEAWRLPDGWRGRNALYQLYHLLNHFLLFGGHYGSQALSIARRYA
ncbi:MAG TPA: fructosamine kinase family protein [Vicinamibacteria bacterium]|nr:fructosamine kinase family protein [Vicinamibacteria bacterium]